MKETKCLICGAELVWQNDFDFEDCGIEGEGIVTIYTCPACEAQIEVYAPAKK